MDRAKASQIQEYLQTTGIFAELEKKLNVKISFAGGRYDATSLTLKISASDIVNGEALKPEVTNWKRYAASFGLPVDALGKEFVSRNQTFKIVGLNPKAHQFPILASSEGKTYKFSVNTIRGCLNVPASAKRAEEQILADIRHVHCELSPENLTCDGELSNTAVNKRERQLNAELSRLECELGRTPTDQEIWKA